MNDDYLLPRLRRDLAYEVIEENDEKIIVLFDPKSYAEQPIALPLQILGVLQLLDGKITKNKLIEILSVELGEPFDFNNIIRLFQYLDYLGYMETQNFYDMKKDIDDYKSSPIRMPVCAGNSYPSEPDELREELDSMLHKASSEFINGNVKAIVVPHIDFRIGDGAHIAYATGYNSLKNCDPNLFVIFGTAHYGNSDLFMFTEKDFQTPLGLVQTDKEIINELRNSLSFKLTIDDMAHRAEHSIELQLVLIQHLFKHKEFTVLPILCGSFYNFIANSTLPSGNNNINELASSLRNIIEKKGKRVVYIASADLAHIGRKFGDDFDAETDLLNLKNEDVELIKNLSNCNADGFYNLISNVKDKRRICGLPPIYTLLQTCQPKSGKFLHYHQWNEQETRSAVSFASIVYSEL